MALQTDLNVSPYYDDFDPGKGFHRILFQPSVAVQARELNQLQTILQAQIEKFGDNIFKRGTIIEGCNIVLHNSLPYIKIKDIETDGTPVNVTEYNNLYVRNVSNVSAFIVKTAVGYESRSPDLNTLFVKYNGSGVTGNSSLFTPGETLTVYDPSNPIFHMRVVDGSGNISNSDSIVVVSSIAVQNSTGGSTFGVGAFNTNDQIQNGVANAIIIEANATANATALILRIKPLPADLLTANTIKWRFTSGETIRNITSSTSANVVATVGTSAAGSLVTDSLGKVISVTVTNMGSGYYVPPYVTASITSGGDTSLAEITQLNITGQNYLTNITVANAAQMAIGTGYGMSVNEGTVYQKGFFSRVSPQLTVVNKYSNTGFTKSVGFYTTEEIVNSNQDISLLDNATGTQNYAAPGADRLKLSPVLTVLEKVDADANTDFLPIVEFADGAAYKQTKQTVYNVIGDEMAKRTFEESGNYVLDQFQLATKDSTTFADTSSNFKIYIDPGIAYINGYRVETVTSYTANVAKGTDVATNNAASIRVGYGNFIRVKELAGIFEFNYGAQIELYDTAAAFVSAHATSTIASSGTKIGAARIRSLILDSGEPGTADAVYRMYLFDIVMSSGKNFNNIRSVYYPSSTKGIADTVLDTTNNTVLVDNKDSSLLFKSINALKYANNVSYTYRTMNQNELANSSGYIDLTLSTGEQFPYTAGGTLNDTEKRDLLVIPRANYQFSSNASGTISTSSSSNVVSGVGTAFTTAFKPGDYIKIANSTASFVKQIQQVTNTTSLSLTTLAGTTMATANAVVYFPNNIPISLTSRDERTVNLFANGQLTIYLGTNIANNTGSASSANVSIVYNVSVNNASTATKTPNRSVYTRVRTANNTMGKVGPWSLGVSDAFRLRKVYQANGASQTKTFAAATDVTSDFISVPNNPFANGDSLTYTVPTSNTVLSGLANNTVYYVVQANSSGTKLSATRNGTVLTVTSSGLIETHSLTGSPLYFQGNTYGVSDVTNNFYIDNNQTEDFLDTSYLYRKPRRPAGSTNDVYFVEFDAFSSGTGVKTVSSYTINDAANLSVLSTGSSINTMEIPEAVGISGKYYDLRDQFDFRPVSSNTRAFGVTSIDTSIVNPVDPTDAARFSAVEQKFPVPNSTLTANVGYYLGRNDRVVLDKNGRFVTIAGLPGSLDSFPPEPRDSITIQFLSIPPYPSLPGALSSEMVEIIDTKVANEKYSKRKDNFKVTTPLDKDQRARIQVKNYQMNDIASLEKRLKDLEYYVSFTLAEAIANAKFIPSSISNAVARFKFGFFVDPFTDFTFSDIDNPEYAASIMSTPYGNQLTAKRVEHIFQLVSENGDAEKVLTLPYTEYNLIAQNDATDGAIDTTVTPVTGDVTTTTVTQTTTSVTEQQKGFGNSDTGSIYEDFYYVFSSLTGPVELYALYRDNYMAFQIAQSTTSTGTYVNTVSSLTASPVGDAYDANDSKGIKGLNAQYSGGVIESGNILNVIGGQGPAGTGLQWIEDSLKILWTHDPSQGQYVRVRAYKGGRHGASQGKAGTYGMKIFYPTDTVTTRTITVTNPSNFNYVGTVHTIEPPSFTLSTTFGFANIDTIGFADFYIADAQSFVISVTGLKPNTFHKFTFNGEDATAKCFQNITSGTNSGSGLKTDANGSMSFRFMYDAGITEATSDFAEQNKLAAAIAGTKAFVIESYGSGNSKAAGSIQMKYYTVAPPITTSGTVNTTQSGGGGGAEGNPYNYSASQVPDKTAGTSLDNYTQTIDWTGIGGSYAKMFDFTGVRII